MTSQSKIIATQVLEEVVKKSSSDRVLIKDLVDAMDSVGFGLAIMIFSFGIIIPLPPPFPSLIAVPLLIFSAQMAAGRASPKLPKRFEKLSVKRSVLEVLTRKSSPYINKIERILRPRLLFMSTPNSERVLGGFILMFSAFILMPVPLSNFIPGFGILVMSFGLLGKDGLVMTVGIVIGLIGMAVSIAAVLMGMEFVYYIKDLFLGA